MVTQGKTCTAWPTSSCSLESAVLINSGHPRLSFNSNCETANTTVDDRQALSNIQTTATYRPKSREEVLVQLPHRYTYLPQVE
jgi:hypothetical protein